MNRTNCPISARRSYNPGEYKSNLSTVGKLLERRRSKTECATEYVARQEIKQGYDENISRLVRYLEGREKKIVRKSSFDYVMATFVGSVKVSNTLWSNSLASRKW